MRRVLFFCIALLFAAPAGNVFAGGGCSGAGSLLREMAGVWDVQQRMWPGPRAEAIQLPPAVAHRRLVQGAFLQESMEPAHGVAQESFTRIATFNCNAVNRQFEYFSIDSREPQMMSERSLSLPPSGAPGGVQLYGESFVAPRWGEARNAAFRYRLAVGGVEQGRQIVGLYLLPLSGDGSDEFLAFEYVYTRRR